MKLNSTGKKKTFIVVTIVIVVFVLCFSYTVVLPMYNYKQGTVEFANRNYSDSVKYFEKAGKYKDSEVKLDLAYFENGKHLYEKEKYQESLEQFLLIKQINDKYEWMESIGVKFLEQGKYTEAYGVFEEIPNIQNEENKFYARAMDLFEKKEYAEAIANFEKCEGVRDASEKILESYYMQGEELFAEKQYFSASEKFQKCLSYADANIQMNNCIFKMGETEWGYEDYESAKEYYLKLPISFEYEGEKVEDRLNALKIYDAVKHLEGNYDVSKGDYRVTQTHNSTGIYHYWYNTEKGYGDLEVDIEINNDGSVTVSGKAEGTRYSTYSSVSSGVKTKTYYASFSKDITSGGLPRGVLYSNDYITLSYNGGTTFTLSYNEVDRSQDVYFRYTYTSNYTFTK